MADDIVTRLRDTAYETDVCWEAAAVIEQLQRHIAAVLAQPEIRDHLLASGVEAVGSSSRQFGNMIRAEITRMGKVIRDAGIRIE